MKAGFLRKYLAQGLIVIAALLVSCMCSACSFILKNEAASDEVRISIMESDGVKVLGGKNYYDVVPGQSVTFEIGIEKDYVYIGNSANGHYDPKTGKLTVSVVKYPMSVEVYTMDVSMMSKVELVSEGIHSDLISVGDRMWFVPGETVTATALESATYQFLGWSTGGYIGNGGRPISNQSEYTFTVDENNLKLYANYQKADQYTIVYHANGGTVSGSAVDTKVVTSKKGTIFTCRNTIHSDGTFKRDGYVAVGYSTQPVNFEDYRSVNDIPGFSNMGGVCVVPDDTNLLDLYVVWAKETESGFTFKLEGKEATLEKYRGSEELLVIPETYIGCPVTKIKANAISGDNIKSVVLPKSIRTVEARAFSSCTKLTQVVFFDGITDISNNSFYQTNRISEIVLNSQRLPVYAGTAEGTFCIKYHRVKTAPGKMLVVVSGSSTLNGMLSEEFQKQYPDYTIVNYGTNAGTSSFFYLSAISKYVGEGDIIIHAGEHGTTTMGANEITWKLFRGNEQCYDIFREVNMSEFTNFWGAFAEYQKERMTGTSVAYQTPCNTMNKYGDLTNNRTIHKDYSLNGNYNFNSPSSYLTSINAERLNAINNVILSRGGIMLGSFATLDIRAVAAECRGNQDSYRAYTEYFAEKLEYPIISNVGTYVMEEKYFYDSIWHCTLEGAGIRTENLLADLKAYLDDPSSY